MHDLDDSAWRARLEELGEMEGYHEPLGAHHAALFADRGPVLLVTFETRASIRAGSDEQLPFGFTLTEAAEHSSLTLIADDESWFRDPAVYAYFDRLVDEAFFDDFDRVVFYGVGSCGYAAAAFSVAAPGATVVMIAPQATLEARRAGWDDRFRHKRRLDFTRRYGYAPDMLDACAQGFVIYDPNQKLDAMHAALMARPQVALLPCRGLGGAVAAVLAEMDVLEPMLSQACAGALDVAEFWRLYRARRATVRYLRNLSNKLGSAGRPWLEAILCRNVVRRIGGPRFRNRLNVLEAQLDAEGLSLPEPLPRRRERA
ncbi:phosphoadenosine phosphosulfate reductase [Rhodobacter lacus]|uniref:Phosphoadenosine phosphosulfate reductase n=1 Tax=Rhodobacter lacus TaxID=1641972 RepID=A0ABW5A9J7_9RHOB